MIQKCFGAIWNRSNWPAYGLRISKCVFHWIGKKLSMSTALVMEHFLIGDCEENRLRGKIGFSFHSKFDISDTFSFRRSYILIVTKICNTSRKLLDIRRIFW